MPKHIFLTREILWADLPARVPVGHEQEGTRPVVVLSVPETVQDIPYRLLIVAPITKTYLTGVLFPLLPAGTARLARDSTVLMNQIMVMDISRIKGRLGRLTELEAQPLRDAMAALFTDFLEV